MSEFWLPVLSQAAENSQLIERFKTCVASICEHTSVNLSFHIVADRDSWVVAKKIFHHLVTTCQQHFDVKYHNVQRIAEELKSVTEMLRVSCKILTVTIYLLNFMLHHLFTVMCSEENKIFDFGACGKMMINLAYQ